MLDNLLNSVEGGDAAAEEELLPGKNANQGVHHSSHFFLSPSFFRGGNVKKSRQNLNEIQNLEQTFHMSQGLYICDMSLKCDTSA